MSGIEIPRWRYFDGVIAYEGRRTDDGRMLLIGAIDWWANLPAPVMMGPRSDIWVEDGRLAGRIDRITEERQPDGARELHAFGYLHTTWRPGQILTGGVNIRELAIDEHAELDDQGLPKHADWRLDITRGELLGFTITQNPAWPGVRLTLHR